MSTISHINTVVPSRVITQQEFADFFSSTAADETIKRQIQMICRRSGIDTRHTVVKDLERIPSMKVEEKMAFYHHEASKLVIEAVEGLKLSQEELEEFTDVITISCTGMQAPGLEFELIDRFNLPRNIRRYNINFMGCYAAITGLRLAQEICRTAGRKVLLVSAELCTLHFRTEYHPDYLISNSLFADGAAAVVISSEAVKGLRIDESASRIIPHSAEDMSWRINQNGFLMTLSNEIPSFIRDLIVKEQLYDRELHNLDWVVHPGGRQILDSIETGMDLENNRLSHSREVLRQFGNMSSATILFVLDRFFKQGSQRKEIIACAFGPGLTFESLLLHEI